MLFYSLKERHKILIQREKTAIMSTNNLFLLYISSIHMLLPENKYLNIYIYIHLYIYIYIYIYINIYKYRYMISFQGRCVIFL